MTELRKKLPCRLKMIRKLIQNDIELPDSYEYLFDKINELVDAVNDLEKEVQRLISNT